MAGMIWVFNFLPFCVKKQTFDFHFMVRYQYYKVPVRYVEWLFFTPNPKSSPKALSELDPKHPS